MKKEQHKRLCSEIQLFDLCTLDACGHKEGRYCTSEDVLSRFEAIGDEEDNRSPAQFLADELDDVEGADDFGYDDAYGVDEYGEEATDEPEDF